MSGGAAYFVDLRLTGADGRSLSTNFYWLSMRPDVLADSSTWYMTLVKSYADFTALRGMPAAAVKVTARFSSRADSGVARVTLRNPGRSIAFFMRLQVTGHDGQEALPVLWEDNYLSLLPGGDARCHSHLPRARSWRRAAASDREWMERAPDRCSLSFIERERRGAEIVA
jgi:hypothetical protein